MAEITCTSLYGLRGFRRGSKVLKSSLRKLKHLTAQFADESVEYTIKGISIQYELLECAIKGKSM